MAGSLQAVNHNKQLMEWSRQVEACRNSGMTVHQWCKENGVPTSTYYGWQRKVFAAVTQAQEVCFAEVPVEERKQNVGGMVAAIAVGKHRIEVYSGADSDTLQEIIKAVTLC